MYLSSHLEHGFSGPVTLLYAASVRLPSLPPGVGKPTAADANLYVSSFLCYYFLLTLLNRAATRCWVYPIFQDVQDALGLAGVAAFKLLIIALGLGFAHAGLALLQYCN